MRLLFLGDVVGRTGRKAIAARLPGLRERLRADFVVVNAENATQGAGLNADHAKALLVSGADCLTLGDHAFDQREMLGAITAEPRILRPLNIAREAPGHGFRAFDLPRGQKILVVQVLGRVFMRQPFDDPFSALDRILLDHPLGAAVGAIIVDAHAEATSEKMALGHWADGRASLVAGTHTHIPTADHRILPKGTAFLSDAGMCGAYDSVIGMEKTEPMRRFVTGLSSARFTPAEGEATICGVLVETDEGSGRAIRIDPIRVGGKLDQTDPGT